MPDPATSYVALAIDNQLRPALYGPYPTDLVARGAGVTIGFTDPDIVATTVLPLAAPEHTDVAAVLAATGREAPGPVLVHLNPGPRVRRAARGRPAR